MYAWRFPTPAALELVTGIAPRAVARASSEAPNRCLDARIFVHLHSHIVRMRSKCESFTNACAGNRDGTRVRLSIGGNSDDQDSRRLSQKGKQLPCMSVTMGGEMRRIVDASRRRVLSGAIAATAAALASKVGAQQSTQRDKPVWLDFDQASLDRAYDQAAYAPNLDIVIKRWETNSEDARTRLGAPRKLQYGPTSIETLDLYPANAKKAPIHVFVHGGAWRAGSASQFSFVAEMFVKRGVHFIARISST